MRAQFIAVATLLLSTAALADDSLTIFVSDLGHQTTHSTETGPITPGQPVTPINRTHSEWTGSIGIALSHAWTPHWSTEGSISYDQRYMVLTKVSGNFAVTGRQHISTTPIDAMMRYHFPNDSRWQPYVAGGAHYSQGPDITLQTIVSSPDPNGPLVFTKITPGNRLSAQVGVGTTLRITPSVGLQFDARRLLRSNGEVWDPLTRLAFGVNWQL